MRELEPADTLTSATPTSMAGPSAASSGIVRRLGRLLGRLVSVALAVAIVGGVIFIGKRTGWSLPKASALRGEPGEHAEDWCAEHSVPESECVECGNAGRPRGSDFGYCRVHGVSDCPLEHPSVAELYGTQEVTAADRERAARALAFAPRPENNPKCKLHQRRIQLASDELVTRLGIRTAAASRAAVEEFITAPGETGYDPTRVVRLSPRAVGTVLRVERQVGEKIRRGDLLAVVESAEVGKAKAEFQQAITHAGLKAQTLARLKELAGSSVAERDVQEADTAYEEARVRLLLAEQELANLGLVIRAADVQGLSPAALARRVQLLGLPEPVARELAGKTESSNLLPVVAPFDGEVIARSAVVGEAADPSKPLFVVADTGRMRLTLSVRMEDASRLRAGQEVRFQHAGHSGSTGWDVGAIVWVSPAADEKTRTVPVRVDLPNPSDRHHANTFGTARVILRSEPQAVVVPSEAVHWEGCCHVVFVRDRDHASGGPKLYHVRKVRPGAKDVASGEPVTEIVAGVLPGELVATANSGVLRSELLKNNLGEG
jgi:cobalt-zinc-cadmium efflux system membrane fusion protein